MVRVHVGIQNFLEMKTIICPKCKQPIVVPKGTDYVICCNEVNFVINEVKLDDEKTMKIAFNSIKYLFKENVPQNSRDEEKNDISRRKTKRSIIKWLCFR